MAMAATSRTRRRRPSSRRMPRSFCGTSPRIPTARRTILPACATPDAMWWGSCPIRSAVMRWFWVVRTAPASSSLWRLAMRRSTLAICALLMVATSGCDQVDAAKAKLKLAWDKLRGRTTAQAPAPPPTRPAPDTAAVRVTSPQERQQQQQQQRTASRGPRPPAAPPGQALTRDVPYVSNDTGTINPGMSEREVYEVWAAPAAARRIGEYTYLFFRNSCEYTCGTMDVVTLKDGKVVDAILRWDGHRYSGESSSPPGRVPVANPGGDTLQMRPPPAPPPAPPPSSAP